MQIKQAVEQYCARREFYAWEIWHLLQQQPYYAHLQMLRRVSQMGEQVAAERVAPRAHHRFLLRSLTDYHLLARARKGRSYHYRVTDLGAQVLGCDRQMDSPTVSNGQMDSPTVSNGQMDRKVGGKCKYPWETLLPQIKQWRREGKNVAEIAKLLHMPYNSLYKYLLRSKRQEHI
jgi:hypothetical protein